LTAKLALKLELEVRELQAAVMKVFLISAESVYVSAASQATKAYNEAIEEASVDQRAKLREQMGEPHLHAWAQLVATALEQREVDEGHLVILSSHQASMKSPVQCLSLVHVCKVKKAFNKENKKIITALASGQEALMEAMTAALMKRGARLKNGQAPRGGLARELQEKIDALNELMR